MNKITYLDATRLYRALVAGIHQVISRQEYLNNINVYPVPDRDTGTNMAMTLNAILEGTYASKKGGINELLAGVADSALNGARGNSGAILAQFFQGLSDGAQHIGGKMTTEQFVIAINRGVDYAYNALSQPKEGTILTIIKEFSNALNEFIKNNGGDFLLLIQAGIRRAKLALAQTTVQLKELKKANVVDAGAQGFVELLEGIYNFIENGSLRNFQILVPDQSVRFITETLDDVAIDEKHRFCTECLILGDNLDQMTVRNRLDQMGSSLVVAGSKQKIKVHIHANDPAEIFDICREYGTLQGEKADDMIHQQRSINHKRSQVAILTDSGADLPEEIISELDIHVVPILISFDQECYIDKVTLSAQEFYHLLKRNPHHPKTSQPSPGDFKRQYQYLSSHYDSVIAIHLPQRISGTFTSSENVAGQIPDSTISVIDSLTTSGAQGLIVQYAAEMAKAGKSHKEIVAATKEIAKKSKLFAVFTNLAYVERGGRLSSGKRKLLQFLRARPILGFDSKGAVKAQGALFGKKNLAEKMAKFTRKKIDAKKAYRMIVTHCNALEEAEKLKNLLVAQHKNIVSIYVMACGAALGAHTGPGTLAVSLQENI